MKKQRKHFLRRHLVEGAPISDLCDERGLQPTAFYRWQKEFFENGAAAFQPRGRTNHQPEQERIAYLEQKIQTKDEVLAELMAEQLPHTHSTLLDRSYLLSRRPSPVAYLAATKREEPSSVFASGTRMNRWSRVYCG